MRRAGLIAAALLMALPVPASVAKAGSTQETAESLPDFPGRELAFGFCAGCHSFQVVGRNGMSRARWDQTLTWMSERHAMPVPDADIRKELLDYLEKAYPERPQSNRGWVNPFAPQGR